MVRRYAYLVVILLVGLAGCGNGQAASHTSPSRRPSPAVSATPDVARCARLAKLGFTPCPPLPSQMRLPPTTIRNATGGAISDETARRWGRAFQLSQAYYYWVMQHGDRDALTSGALADQAASVNVFGPDLMDIDRAREWNGKLVDRPPALAEIRLVVLPSSLKEAMSKQGLAQSDYGFVIELRGPASRSVSLPSGQRRALWSVDASQVQWLLEWGQYERTQDLGDIWYAHSLYGCSGVVQSTCSR